MPSVAAGWLAARDHPDGAVTVVADPAYRKALKDRGFEASGDAPQELAAFMEKDYIKNRDLIQKLGLQTD